MIQKSAMAGLRPVICSEACSAGTLLTRSTPAGPAEQAQFHKVPLLNDAALALASVQASGTSSHCR